MKTTTVWSRRVRFNALNRGRTTLVVVLLALMLSSGFVLASPIGTAFHYQGTLIEESELATGLYDLQFTLWDAPTNGNQPGAVVLKENVSIVSGLFAVELDFGAEVFTGDARWFEMAAQPSGGGGGFAILSPRQPMQPVPYSVYSSGAGAVANPAFLGTTTSMALELYAGNAPAVRNALPDPLVLGSLRVGTFTRLADGQFELRLEGGLPGPIEIQASEDFIQWTTLTTVQDLDGTFVFTDEEAGSFNQRFYRAVAP